jgi:uncharacterized OB-fold protein
MTEEMRPTPAVDADSAPYWAATLEGRLLLPRCASCARFIFYPRAVCPYCMSRDLPWEQLSGLGTVYTYTIVHKAPPGFHDEVPYAVASVDLDEGVRMMTRIVDCPVEEVTIGSRVRVVFRDLSQDAALPCFTPVVE